MIGSASLSRAAKAALPRCVASFVLAGLLLLPVTDFAHAQKTTVFAAASLKNAMDVIAVEWKQATGGEAVIVLAGSSALARQIIQGAPADIFISANAEWMDAVEEAGMVEPGTRLDLLGNRLVLIAHGRNAPEVDIGNFDLAEALGDGRLAMALVDAVPAGIYGKTALQSLGMWDSLQDRIAQTDNVRAALALVATGEAPFGIVYATDAAAADNVTIAAEFAAGSHPPIIYPAAAIRGGSREQSRFLDFLKSPPAVSAFERQGFTVLD